MVLNLFYNRLKFLTESGLIWKIQLDTYIRELERYGNDLIEESESIFYEDSKCLLQIINKLSIYKNEDYSWMIGLKLIDSFLTDLSFNLQSKLRLVEILSNSFKSEFGFNQYNSKQFNTMNRNNRNTVESVLSNKIVDENFKKLCEIIKIRSKHLKPIINQLNLKVNGNKKRISLENLISSYLHMTFNRLFISKNRTYELILYRSIGGK